MLSVGGEYGDVPVVAGGLEEALGAIGDVGVDVHGDDMSIGADEFCEVGRVDTAGADLSTLIPGVISACSICMA